MPSIFYNKIDCCPPCQKLFSNTKSPDTKLIEKIWPTIKRDVYKNRKRYSSKHFCEAVKVWNSRKFSRKSMVGKLMKVIECQGLPINT